MKTHRLAVLILVAMLCLTGLVILLSLRISRLERVDEETGAAFRQVEKRLMAIENKP